MINGLPIKRICCSLVLACAGCTHTPPTPKMESPEDIAAAVFAADNAKEMSLKISAACLGYAKGVEENGGGELIKTYSMCVELFAESIHKFIDMHAFHVEMNTFWIKHGINLSAADGD